MAQVVQSSGTVPVQGTSPVNRTLRNTLIIGSKYYMMFTNASLHSTKAMEFGARI
jgi:hypothetical protein